MSYKTVVTLNISPSRARPFQEVSIEAVVSGFSWVPDDPLRVRVQIFWETWPSETGATEGGRLLDRELELKKVGLPSYWTGLRGYESSKVSTSYKMHRSKNVRIDATVWVWSGGRWANDNWDMQIITFDGASGPPPDEGCREGEWYCQRDELGTYTGTRVVCKGGQWIFEPNSWMCPLGFNPDDPTVQPPEEEEEEEVVPPYTPPPEGNGGNGESVEERDWLGIGMTAAAIGMVGFAVVSLLKSPDKPRKEEERKLLPPPREREDDGTPMYRRAAGLYGYGRS